MTTDTYPKISVKNVILDNIRFKIFGIAKGSYDSSKYGNHARLYFH